MARAARRGFGNIRRLPSGRYQASYAGPDQQRHSAPTTFSAKIDAEGWLSSERRVLESHHWTSPKQRQAERERAMRADQLKTFRRFAMRWLEGKSRSIRAQTESSYRSSLEIHLLPTFGDRRLDEISEEDVEVWFYGYGDQTPTARAHAYQVLKGVMLAAAEASVINRNPCRIKGGHRTAPEHEQEILTFGELQRLYEAMPEHHRALVLLSGLGGLRLGEALALRRRDIDLSRATVTVRGSIIEDSGSIVRSSRTKTPAGQRTLHLPRQAVEALRRHLRQFPVEGRNDLVFSNSRGGPLRHQTVYGRGSTPGTSGRPQRQAYGWHAAREAIGRPALKFHDLRHTAATLAARSGATPKEVMTRLGHTGLTVAMRYQGADAERDRQTAERLATEMDNVR